MLYSYCLPVTLTYQAIHCKKFCTAIAIQLTHVVQPYRCSSLAVFYLYWVMLKVVVIRFPCTVAIYIYMCNPLHTVLAI